MMKNLFIMMKTIIDLIILVKIEIIKITIQQEIKFLWEDHLEDIIIIMINNKHIDIVHMMHHMKTTNMNNKKKIINLIQQNFRYQLHWKIKGFALCNEFETPFRFRIIPFLFSVYTPIFFIFELFLYMNNRFINVLECARKNSFIIWHLFFTMKIQMTWHIMCCIINWYWNRYTFCTSNIRVT